MNEAHTPGQWIVSEEVCPFDVSIFDGSTYHRLAYDIQRESDARLMAAAPELLDALQALVDRHEGYVNGFGPCVCGAHVRARTIIAKAEGR